MKTCTKCQLDKPKSEFYERSPGILRKDCKECSKERTKKKRWEDPELRRKYDRDYYKNNRDEMRKRDSERYHSKRKYDEKYILQKANQRHLKKYGISLSEKELLLNKQECKCMVCKNPLRFEDSYTDHCHKTKKIRGILCLNCNILLGHAKDSVELLQSAINYLSYPLNHEEI